MHTFLVPLLLALGVAAPTGEIQGSLAQQDGTPLAYGCVLVLQTRRGAIAGEDGSFLVQRIPAGRQIVRFQYVGFEIPPDTIEVKAGEVVRLHITVPNPPRLKEVCPCANHEVVPIEFIGRRRTVARTPPT